jgi:hypothetical protein
MPSRPTSEILMDKLFAAAWVIFALMVGFYSDFWHVLFSSETKAIRPLLYIVATLVGINTVLMGYLTIYLPVCKGLVDSNVWNVYCPRVIPTMTLFGVMAYFLLMRSCWAVYGFLSPIIVSTEALGCLFALHFIPWPF